MSTCEMSSRKTKDCKDTVTSKCEEESQEKEPEEEEESENEVVFGVFRTDECGNLVQVGFGQPKDPGSSHPASLQISEQLPERGWGKNFLQQQSSAFGSFHENPNPFLFPGQVLTRPSQPSAAPFGRGGGFSGSRGGFTPAGPSLPPQEALFSSIKMKEKVSQRPLIISKTHTLKYMTIMFTIRMTFFVLGHFTQWYPGCGHWRHQEAGQARLGPGHAGHPGWASVGSHRQGDQ